MRNGFNAAVLACAVAAAGCGASDGGQPKAEVVTKANAICKKFDAMSKQFDKANPKTPEDAVVLLARARPIFNRMIEEMAQLDPPKNDREPFDRMIDLGREQVALVGDMEDAITTRDGSRLQADSSKLDSSSVRINIAAQQYGLTDCLDDEWTQAP
jgi:hypothetical protein